MIFINVTPEQINFAQMAKNEGYYILKSIDKRKKMFMYQLVKDIDSNSKKVKFEMNKSAYLLAKFCFKFNVITQEVSFCNFVPFAERNKDKNPLQELKY
jgi:uncharacterized FlgJ-related protein